MYTVIACDYEVMITAITGAVVTIIGAMAGYTHGSVTGPRAEAPRQVDGPPDHPERTPPP